jgi:hypothetical protein
MLNATIDGALPATDAKSLTAVILHGAASPLN